MDGNLDEDGQWGYTWDAENRLKAMTSTLPTSGGYTRRRLEFTYDYLGRRVEKQVTDLTTSAVSARRYVYDGWNLVAELAVSGGAAGGVVRSYTWGLDVSGTLGGAGGIGALVQFTVHAGTSTTDYYPSYDGQGNVTALIRSDGVLAAAYEYGPFGEMLRAEVSDTTVADNPFRHATKFSDLESGLVYYGLRYYSPSLGRFINRDPIGEAGGVNLYAFVGNDPGNRWDYLGLDDEAPNLTKCIWVKEGGEWVLKCDDADDGATKLEPFEVRGDRVHGYSAPTILLYIPNVAFQFYGPGMGNGGGSPGGGSPNGGSPSDSKNPDCAGMKAKLDIAATALQNIRNTVNSANNQLISDSQGARSPLTDPMWDARRASDLYKSAQQLSSQFREWSQDTTVAASTLNGAFRVVGAVGAGYSFGIGLAQVERGNYGSGAAELGRGAYGTTMMFANLMRADGTITGSWLRTANPTTLVASLAILDVQIAYTNIKTGQDLQALVNNMDTLMQGLDSALAKYKAMKQDYAKAGCK